MPSLKIPADTAKKLRETSDGITGIAQKVKQDFLVDLDDSGLSMCIRGYNKEILELAVDALQRLVYDDKPKSSVSLGSLGTVKWVFRDKQAKHVQHLFSAELDELRAIPTVSINVSPDAFNPMEIEVKGNQSVFAELKRPMSKLQNRLSTVVSTTVGFETRERTLAKQFEKVLDEPNVYCRMHFGKELVFFGKIFSQVKAAVSKWESYRSKELGKRKCFCLQ